MLSTSEGFYLKVADLNVSEDFCGTYIFRIYGSRSDYFKIVDNTLYMIKSPTTLPISQISITISLEDPAKRFTPITQVFTLDILCYS